MLTEKYKDFIEKIAQKIQLDFNNLKSPNNYDFKEVIDWLKENGAEIAKGRDNYTQGHTIYLNFIDEGSDDLCISKKIEKSYERKKIFFHEFWHFMVNKIDAMQNETLESTNSDLAFSEEGFSAMSISPLEMSANLFSRAMLFPEDGFIKSIIKNVGVNGHCDIYTVANEFSANYADVIARGNDLSLWSTKVG